jgi:hypothetical protein
MVSSNLCLHKGARFVGLDELAQVKTPPTRQDSRIGLGTRGCALAGWYFFRTLPGTSDRFPELPGSLRWVGII